LLRLPKGDAGAPAYRLHPDPRGEPDDVNPAFPAPRSWWMRNIDAWQKIHMSLLYLAIASYRRFAGPQ
jgi:hypothetical protein